MQFLRTLDYLRHKLHPVRLFHRAKNSYIEFHAHAEFKIYFVCFIGMISFPAYYVTWKYIFPQPYESITLRTIGFIFALFLVLTPYWPRRFLKYRAAFSYVGLIYCLPFFFTVMLLMNDANIVWQLSTMACLLFVVLLYDTINIVVATFLGAILGYLYYFLITGSGGIPKDLFVVLPIFIFTFMGIVFLNYRGDVITKAKLNAAATLASHMAHEMRTPLLGIQLEAQKVNKYIPKLTEAYDWAKDNGWSGGGFSKKQLSGVSGSMGRIKEHSSSANLVVDMLLMNVRREDIAKDEFSIHSMKKTINTAIERYHFRPGETDMVMVEGDEDFDYWGTEVLMVHVMFNLMRNSLRAIHSKGRGLITIRLQPGENTNYLFFRDTGQGMPADIINYIFIPFFSGVHNSGAGVGLSFVQHVVESSGGTITCHSILGRGTEFVIALPKIHSSKFTPLFNGHDFTV